MKNLTLILMVFVVTLIGCEWDEKEKKNEEKAQGIYFKQILFEEEITSETFALHAQTGDYIKAEVTGLKYIPQFSGVCHRASTSTWEKNIVGLKIALVVFPT